MNCRIPPASRPSPVQLAAALAASLSCVIAANGQCLNNTLLPSIPNSESQFGLSGAMDGDRIIIGSPFDDIAAGQNHGSVDLFRKSGGGWVGDGRLIAPSPEGYAQYGRSVDVDGIFAVVGEPRRTASGNNDVGCVHLYVRQSTGWQYGLTFAPNIANWPNIANSYFGQAVSIDGDYLLVGMPDGPVSGNSKPGKAYLYRRTFGNTNWEIADILEAPAGSFDEHDFGAVLAIQHGDAQTSTCAVIGNPMHSPTISLINSGQVRIYNKPTSGSDWGAGTPITPNDPQFDARFGSAVAIDGNMLAVGAPEFDGALNPDSGAVYIFSRTRIGVWVQVARIDDPVGNSGANFGARVALRGDRLVVGGRAKMHVYRLVAGTWMHEWTMRGETTDFGERAVGIGGNDILTTRPNAANGSMILSGEATVYTLAQGHGANTCAMAPYVATGSAWGCTTAATRDGRSSCDGVSTGLDVWYRWVAPCNGIAEIDTEFSDFDTLLSIHSDCPVQGDTHQVACNQIAASNYALVNFNAIEGQTYLIRVSGAQSDDEGNYILNIAMNCTPPCDADIAPQPSGDSVVNVSDLLLVISTWGQLHGAGDTNHDALVNVTDLLAVISAWGECPGVP